MKKTSPGNSEESKDAPMPRYVILEHDWPQRHWDFMLETGTVLQTWKLANAPKPGVRIPAEKSFDHRLIYLDYEGPISGGRGSVTRWDAGFFSTVTDQENRLVIRLDGGRLQGVVELTNLKEGWTWQLLNAGKGPTKTDG